MSLSYTWRLLCLCCASFFVLHLALAVATRLSAGTAVRMAARMKPSSAARFLFFLRISPMALTVFAVLAFCIPSYLWLEPDAAGEKVGFDLLPDGDSRCRDLGLVHHACRLRGSRDGSAISTNANVTGGRFMYRESLLRPCCSPTKLPCWLWREWCIRGWSSRELFCADSPLDQRDAALRHERAHRTSRDNIKRFLILLSPDVLPFLRAFTSLERSWAKFTEWAADDQAAEGDSHRALSLASALVCVAKMGSRPKLSYLFSSLMDDDQDLTERVDRLLRPQPSPGKPAEVLIPFLTSTGALIAAAAAVVLLWPGSLSLVHRALERLVH